MTDRSITFTISDDTSTTGTVMDIDGNVYQTIKIGNQVSNATHTTCFYPSYQFLIDWNGDVFLCPQDWQRRTAMGNMMQENIFEIWTGKILTQYRKRLLKGKRDLSPCSSCNAQGTLLGQTHAKIWREIYK